MGIGLMLLLPGIAGVALAAPLPDATTAGLAARVAAALALTLAAAGDAAAVPEAVLPGEWLAAAEAEALGVDNAEGVGRAGPTANSKYATAWPTSDTFHDAQPPASVAAAGSERSAASCW
jgi:hypothetical protein